MSQQRSSGFNKPSPSWHSNASREPYAYTPSWMTPAERAKLRARLRKIREKEGIWRVKKEEDTLLRKSPSTSPPKSLSQEKQPQKEKSPSQEKSAQKQKSPSREKHPQKQKSPSREKHPQNQEEVKSILDGDPAAVDLQSAPTMSEEPSLTAHDSRTLRDSTRKSSDSKKSSKSHNKDNSMDTSMSKKKSKEELAMAKKNQKSKHPKAAHANPSGNRVEDQPPWIPHPRESLEAHLWATDFNHFDPQLYAFRTPEKLSTKRAVVAECPPFWVLNDHTIAVAWKLFNKDADRSDLGIVALQWSREFVSAMKDERGEYPIAIKHLLDAIEDGLIFRYSRADEDHKTAHHKNDDISYASSDSVFKHPTEVSYTLKDIMSRNFPGRKYGDDHEALLASSVMRKEMDANASAVSKSFAPVTEGDTMNQKDLVALLRQCKIEQEARIRQEINTSKEIERLLQQAQEGKLPLAQSGKKPGRHLDFNVPADIMGSEPSLATSKKKHHDEEHLKKTQSGASTKSNASAKSHASQKSGKSSGKSGKSRESLSSVDSDFDAISNRSAASKDSKASTKAMQKKKSKENVAKKSSEDSVSSQKSNKSEKGKEGSKGSTSGEKKGGKGSKGSKGSK